MGRQPLPLTLPVTPQPGRVASGMTPEAKRPRARGPALQPIATAMSLENLTGAFYAFLGSFQAEQLFVDDINNVVASHADDLDGFRNTCLDLSKNNITLDENYLELNKKLEQYETDMNKRLNDMTTMMKTGAQETIAHVQAGVVTDQKVLYQKISEERKTHVESNGLDLYNRIMSDTSTGLQNNEQSARHELQEFKAHIEEQVRQVGVMVNTGNAGPAGPAGMAPPPGLFDIARLRTKIENLDESVALNTAGVKSLGENASRLGAEIANMQNQTQQTDQMIRNEVNGLASMVQQCVNATTQGAPAQASGAGGYGNGTIGAQLDQSWQPAAQTQAFRMDTPHGDQRNGTAHVEHGGDEDGRRDRTGEFGREWKLYDEKYSQQPHNYYNAKDPQGWLLGLQDYLSSRCQEIDDFLKWVSEQEE